MGKVKTWATAGLVFVKARNLDITEAANLVVSGFKKLGHRVTSAQTHSEVSALVTTNAHSLELSVEKDVALLTLPEPAALVLSIKITDSDQKGNTQFARDSVLARTLQALHDHMKPDFVKWIDSDVLLSSETFASATRRSTAPAAQKGRVKPRRVTTAPLERLPNVDETNDILQKRITDHDPVIFGVQGSPDRLRKIFTESWVDPDVAAAAAHSKAREKEMEDIEVNAPLRLSAWMISFAVTLFALPLGVVLMLLNIVKGENLRLASQTAALTGTFLALETYGASAQAIDTLQKLIG